MKGYTFTEGEEVIHISNPRIAMTVQSIKKQRVALPEDKFLLKMVGIECYWFDNNNSIQKGVFHSKKLIPKVISDQGTEAINNFFKTV